MSIPPPLPPHHPTVIKGGGIGFFSWWGNNQSGSGNKADTTTTVPLPPLTQCYNNWHLHLQCLGQQQLSSNNSKKNTTTSSSTTTPAGMTITTTSTSANPTIIQQQDVADTVDALFHDDAVNYKVHLCNIPLLGLLHQNEKEDGDGDNSQSPPTTLLQVFSLCQYSSANSVARYLQNLKKFISGVSMIVCVVPEIDFSTSTNCDDDDDNEQKNKNEKFPQQQQHQPREKKPQKPGRWGMSTTKATNASTSTTTTRTTTPPAAVLVPVPPCPVTVATRAIRLLIRSCLSYFQADLLSSSSSSSSSSSESFCFSHRARPLVFQHYYPTDGGGQKTSSSASVPSPSSPPSSSSVHAVEAFVQSIIHDEIKTYLKEWGDDLFKLATRQGQGRGREGRQDQDGAQQNLDKECEGGGGDSKKRKAEYLLWLQSRLESMIQLVPTSPSSSNSSSSSAAAAALHDTTLVPLLLHQQCVIEQQQQLQLLAVNKKKLPPSSPFRSSSSAASVADDAAALPLRLEIIACKRGEKMLLAHITQGGIVSSPPSSSSSSSPSSSSSSQFNLLQRGTHVVGITNPALDNTYVTAVLEPSAIGSSRTLRQLVEGGGGGRGGEPQGAWKKALVGSAGSLVAIKLLHPAVAAGLARGDTLVCPTVEVRKDDEDDVDIKSSKTAATTTSTKVVASASSSSASAAAPPEIPLTSWMLLCKVPRHYVFSNSEKEGENGGESSSLSTTTTTTTSISGSGTPKNTQQLSNLLRQGMFHQSSSSNDDGRGTSSTSSNSPPPTPPPLPSSSQRGDPSNAGLSWHVVGGELGNGKAQCALVGWSVATEETCGILSSPFWNERKEQQQNSTTVTSSSKNQHNEDIADHDGDQSSSFHLLAPGEIILCLHLQLSNAMQFSPAPLLISQNNKPTGKLSPPPSTYYAYLQLLVLAGTTSHCFPLQVISTVNRYSLHQHVGRMLFNGGKDSRDDNSSMMMIPNPITAARRSLSGAVEQLQELTRDKAARKANKDEVEVLCGLLGNSSSGIITTTTTTTTSAAHKAGSDDADATVNRGPLGHTDRLAFVDVFERFHLSLGQELLLEPSSSSSIGTSGIDKSPKTSSSSSSSSSPVAVSSSYLIRYLNLQEPPLMRLVVAQAGSWTLAGVKEARTRSEDIGEELEPTTINQDSNVTKNIITPNSTNPTAAVQEKGRGYGEELYVKPPTWQFETDRVGVYSDLQKSDQDVIETHYQRYYIVASGGSQPASSSASSFATLSRVELTLSSGYSATVKYVFDFSAMTQTNTTTGKVRKLQRQAPISWSLPSGFRNNSDSSTNGGGVAKKKTTMVTTKKTKNKINNSSKATIENNKNYREKEYLSLLFRLFYQHLLFTEELVGDKAGLPCFGTSGGGGDLEHGGAEHSTFLRQELLGKLWPWRRFMGAFSFLSSSPAKVSEYAVGGTWGTATPALSVTPQRWPLHRDEKEYCVSSLLPTAHGGRSDTVAMIKGFEKNLVYQKVIVFDRLFSFLLTMTDVRCYEEERRKIAWIVTDGNPLGQGVSDCYVRYCGDQMRKAKLLSRLSQSSTSKTTIASKITPLERHASLLFATMCSSAAPVNPMRHVFTSSRGQQPQGGTGGPTTTSSPSIMYLNSPHNIPVERNSFVLMDKRNESRLRRLFMMGAGQSDGGNNSDTRNPPPPPPSSSSSPNNSMTKAATSLLSPYLSIAASISHNSSTVKSANGYHHEQSSVIDNGGFSILPPSPSGSSLSAYSLERPSTVAVLLMNRLLGLEALRFSVGLSPSLVASFRKLNGVAAHKKPLLESSSSSAEAKSGNLTSTSDTTSDGDDDDDDDDVVLAGLGTLGEVNLRILQSGTPRETANRNGFFLTPHSFVCADGDDEMFSIPALHHHHLNPLFFLAFSQHLILKCMVKMSDVLSATPSVETGGCPQLVSKFLHSTPASLLLTADDHIFLVNAAMKKVHTRMLRRTFLCLLDLMDHFSIGGTAEKTSIAATMTMTTTTTTVGFGSGATMPLLAQSIEAIIKKLSYACCGGPGGGGSAATTNAAVVVSAITPPPQWLLWRLFANPILFQPYRVSRDRTALQTYITTYVNKNGKAPSSLPRFVYQTFVIQSLKDAIEGLGIPMPWLKPFLVYCRASSTAKMPTIMVDRASGSGGGGGGGQQTLVQQNQNSSSSTGIKADGDGNNLNMYLKLRNAPTASPTALPSALNATSTAVYAGGGGGSGISIHALVISCLFMSAPVVRKKLGFHLLCYIMQFMDPVQVGRDEDEDDEYGNSSDDE